MKKSSLAVCTLIVAAMYMLITMYLTDYYTAQVIKRYNLPNDIFGDESGYTLDAEESRYKNYQITYGEVLAPGIRNMWTLARQNNINSFVDLGSGTGKTVLIAHLMGFKEATGIEIVHSRHRIAMSMLPKLGEDQKMGITFILGDAFRYDFNQQVPHLIFMSNLVWTKQSICNIFSRIASVCAPGTVVVSSYCYMHPKDKDKYVYVGTIRTPMTWNYFSYCYVHRLI